jgi:hypothetical protein
MPMEKVEVSTTVTQGEGMPDVKRQGAFNFPAVDNPMQAMEVLMSRGLTPPDAEKYINSMFKRGYATLVTGVARKKLESLPLTFSQEEVNHDLQMFMDAYVPGTHVGRRAGGSIDPVKELAAQLPLWPRSKQRETLAKLGLNPDMADGLPCVPEPSEASLEVPSENGTESQRESGEEDSSSAEEETATPPYRHRVRR